MVLVKANADTEGCRPSEEDLRVMGEYNERLVEAGIMLAGEGLHPSARGCRVRFEEAGHHTIIDGPFTEARELVAGYWMWQVRSLEEAAEWIKRAPFRAGTELELRPVMGMDDFGEAMTPELRAQEQRLRALNG